MAQLANCFDLSRAAAPANTQNKTPFKRREQVPTQHQTFPPLQMIKLTSHNWATLFALGELDLFRLQDNQPAEKLQKAW